MGSFSPMSCVSLKIIAEEASYKALLEDAFEDAFEGDVGGEEGSCAIVCVLTPNNVGVIKKQKEEMPVFAIIDPTLNKKDYAEFDIVFTPPVYLGNVVEAVKRMVRYQEMCQALNIIKLGKKIIINPQTSEFHHMKNSVRLTEKELFVLIFLSKNLEKPVGKDRLLQEVWGYAKDVETHTLETHIYRLRQKIQTGLGLYNFLVTKDDGYLLKF